MKASMKIDGAIVTVDLSRNYDLSLPLQASPENPLVWGAKRPIINPFEEVDSVSEESDVLSLDTNTIIFNQNTNYTRSVCIGHITPEFYSINKILKDYVFCAEVISVVPENYGEDYYISKKQLLSALKGAKPTALVIRTLPNTETKKSIKYTGTNWAYLEESAAAFLAEIGVKHLLIDLPSIDKEGVLEIPVAHKAFWQYPETPRLDCTITELIYVPNEVEDGAYLLNLLIPPLENNSTPSKPILYPFMNNTK